MQDDAIKKTILKSKYPMSFKDMNGVLKLANKSVLFFFKSTQINTIDKLVGYATKQYNTLNKKVEEDTYEKGVTRVINTIKYQRSFFDDNLSLTLANGHFITFDTMTFPIFKNKKMFGFYNISLINNQGIDSLQKIFSIYMNQYDEELGIEKFLINIGLMKMINTYNIPKRLYPILLHNLYISNTPNILKHLSKHTIHNYNSELKGYNLPYKEMIQIITKKLKEYNDAVAIR